MVAVVTAALFCFMGVGHTADSNAGEVPDPDDRSTGTSRAAIDKFWAIYHGNGYDAIPEVQKELETAIQSDPNNPTLYALLGATHFWHVGEATRDRNAQANRQILAQDMPTAAALFQKALDLDYYTQHPIGYINDDHLPGYLGITTFHTGQEYQDPNLMAKGEGILNFAAYQFGNSIISIAGRPIWTIQGTARATRKHSTGSGRPLTPASEGGSTARIRT